MDIKFDDRMLLLKVNANKSELIQICLKWEQVTILDPYELPLTDRENTLEVINKYYSMGLDIRLCEEPYDATHFLALSSYLNTCLKACVLKGVPIISEDWLRHAWDNLNDLRYWLTTVAKELLYPSDFSSPRKARAQLLQEKVIIACYNDKSFPKLRNFSKWMRVFLPNAIHEVNVGESNALAKIIEITRNSKTSVYLFQLDYFVVEPSIDIIGKLCNTPEDLWTAVIAVDKSSLRKITILDLTLESLLKRESTSQDSGRSVQRKRRRKIERVSETDFFLFSLSAAPTQINTNSQALSTINSATESDLIPGSAGIEKQKGTESKIDEIVTTSDSKALPENQDDCARVQSSSSSKTEPLEICKSLIFSDPPTLEKKSNDIDEKSSKPEFNVQSTPKLGDIKGVSLSEAIIATKNKAEEGIKNEFYEGEPLEEGIKNLVIIEEIELRRPKICLEAVNTNSQYSGRKNFKAFRKVGVASRNVTRACIQLYDENSVQLKDKSVVQAPISYRYAADFAEIGTVSGFQPESQPLFVSEESDNDLGDGRFAFLSGQNGHTIAESDDESDGDIHFKFTT